MTAAPTAGGVVTSGVGVAGVGVGLLGMFGPVRVVHVGWLLPLSGVHIELDRLGGFFMALTGAVAAPVGCYLIGYVRREHLGRVPMAVVPLFVAAMLLVPAAGSVTTFLLAWELMAIASLILVLSEHARPQVRSAGLWYAVMTQLGFIAILVGLVVLAAAGGSDRFAGLGAVCDGVRAAVFMLTLVGFGSKAGLVPLHAWLPRAHPEAPSPVSALMSAAMVNLGIYGIVRFDLQLLGPGPRWWGLALLAVGGTSALYGVLQASVAADLKRLLAYSTTENMGLITLALGAATLFADTGAYGPASIAAAAAMLHMIAHAAFKSLAFMAAGSVLAATGLRDLDLLGGLARRMPATTVFFGVAALGACGLPLGAGFVSEWLLVQSLIHAAPGHDPIVALTTPLAVGVVALATGLSVAAMTKAFGIGFLARPRSASAAPCQASSRTMARRSRRQTISTDANTSPPAAKSTRIEKLALLIAGPSRPHREEVGGGDREQGQQKRAGQQFGYPEQSQFGEEHLERRQQHRENRDLGRHRHHAGQHVERGGRGAGDPPRQEQIRQQCQQHREPHPGRPFDQRQPWAGVLEDHGLVHHRQFQVGGRVVHRQPPGLGDDDNHQRHEGQYAGQRHHVARVVDRTRHQRTEIGRSGGDGQREHRQQDRWFDQCGDGDLAAGAHAAERGAGVDAGQGQCDGAQE